MDGFCGGALPHTDAAKRARRTSALVWGVIAELVLVSLLILSGVSGPSEGLWHSLVLLASVALTAVGVFVVAVAPRLTRGIKWLLSVLLASLAGGLAVIGIADLATGVPANAGALPLFALAVIGMDVVAAHISRAGHASRQ